MNLRLATLDDLPFLLDLEARFRSLGFVGGDPAEVHQCQMVDSDCRYWVVEQEGRGAGYVILRGLTSPNRTLELKRIVIADPGKGLGRSVLREVISRAFQEFGAHRLWLDVFDDNARARHLYQSLGFVEEGVLRECFPAPDRFRSLVVMSMLEHEFRHKLGQ
ncbi:MAG: GNAT family protein [Acidobacteriota bacterium]